MALQSPLSDDEPAVSRRGDGAMETVILNRIYNAACDESLSERDAIAIIMTIVEDRLAELGMFPDATEGVDR